MKRYKRNHSNERFARQLENELNIDQNEQDRATTEEGQETSKSRLTQEKPVLRQEVSPNSKQDVEQSSRKILSGQSNTLPLSPRPNNRATIKESLQDSIIKSINKANKHQKRQEEPGQQGGLSAKSRQDAILIGNKHRPTRVNTEINNYTYSPKRHQFETNSQSVSNKVQKQRHKSKSDAENRRVYKLAESSEMASFGKSRSND